MKNLLLLIFLISQGFSKVKAQYSSSLSAEAWADSILATLSPDEKIAQLMVIRAHSDLGKSHVDEITKLIREYNIGGLCFFQGGPVRQANLTNYYQSIAKTPLMICIDGEWGLGMRLDSVINFPRQLMLGAVNDATIAYEYGKAIGEQCKRIGIQVNYAPVVDINNNPANPVINDRSFGEDKYKVALYGVQYMKGMQDLGVLGCAKHFPGHGDVNVDSHYDLPVINKTREQLDSLELYPFRKIFEEGVGSVMIAHLYIPSIDNTANRATSLSYKNVTELLRKELKYEGISFTDALEMKGVAKFFPKGEASLQSLLAGNDMLCLPGDIPGSIQLVRKAIKKKKLSWDDIDARVKKVLLAKYRTGLNVRQVIDTKGIVEDLNRNTARIQRLVAENAITLVKEDGPKLPLQMKSSTKVAYVGVGLQSDNLFAQQMRSNYNADVFYFSNNQDLSRVASLTDLINDRYDVVVVGLHNYSRRPANNFGLSAASQKLVNELGKSGKTVTLFFGNPYAIALFPHATTVLACYEDDRITQEVTMDIVSGKKEARGVLPVSVSDSLHFGTGITDYLHQRTAKVDPDVDLEKLAGISAITEEAVMQGATPGGVVLVARKGNIIYEQAFGKFEYPSDQEVTMETVYDLASITKIAATTLAVMKLYEEGKIVLNHTLGEYLPSVRGTDKEKILIDDLLLHQGGLKSWIPFYKETIDPLSGVPLPGFYATEPDSLYSVRVADTMYLRSDWVDTMFARILTTESGPPGQYVYSDNDFIFLGKIVEAITGTSLNEYVSAIFYEPLGLSNTAFNAYQRFPLSRIAPTEREPYFRRQLIHGYVHDPGAAMMGGVSGHAGLFSNAHDLWKLFQMLLNGGEWEGQRYLKQETIDLFTSYGTANSRRALGFDKPEKDNAVRKEPYPALGASPFTYGHTGFTGTCVWVDPREELVYIFLSNRVHPDGNNNKLQRLKIRERILDTIYLSIRNGK